MPSLLSSSQRPDPLFSCPRILCLHGGGSNSTIFRISCKVLEAQLASHARLVYADAPFFAPPGPLITGVFADWGPFRSWLPPALGVGPGKGQGVECIDEDPTDAGLVIERIDQSLRTAMEEDDRVGGTGPWVGLLGFSQGAKIVASLLLRQQPENGRPGSLPVFSFGVLVAGPAPLVWLMPPPEDAMPLQSSPKPTLQIPTVHVYGARDSVLSSSDDWLYHGCSPDSRKLIVWDGDHFMPTRTKDVAAVVRMITELLDETFNNTN
ncbi:serine hydrolase FSH [Hypomontagnella monticulosa]|nr:serine hydrolase FSH [Hypomontagnella monticulosa]